MSEPAGKRIRVVAVEDDPRYRSSLQVLLHYAEDFELVETFPTADAVLHALGGADREGRAPHWDLVLMDLGLPGMTGAECTSRIKEILPDVAVVALTVFEDRSSILGAICAGADGYLLKRTPADELLHQLRAVMAGGSPISAGVARTVLEVMRKLDEGGRLAARTPPDRVGLTPRERQVLGCLVEGSSYKAVASELGISIDTVRSHIRSVYRKLQVTNVAEAVSRALRQRLV